MCGEHSVVIAAVRSDSGSSPHVRGTPCCFLVSSSAGGIIPACAGNTNSTNNPTGIVRDHPRMCGEHPRSSRGEDTRRGSSPHVRGTPMVVCRSWWLFGIIPACAGNTDYGVWVSRASRGSSPHVRGTRFFASASTDALGIIPACAGNTSCTRCTWTRIRDHPRMCGEHFASRLHSRLKAGSSPHVRGTLPAVLPVAL